VSGNVTSVDGLNYYNYYNYSYYQPGYGWVYGQNYLGSSSGSTSTTTPISASTQIQVSNVAPTITQIKWDTSVLTGQDFAFTTTATDPGLAGGDKLTFAFDLNGTGQYNDFVQSGGTSAGGTYHFDTAGVHTVGIRVTDSSGDSTYGHFDVQVNTVPEPASLALLGVGAVGLAAYGWRRRRTGRLPRA
jgi:hypothetical protein